MNGICDQAVIELKPHDNEKEQEGVKSQPSEGQANPEGETEGDAAASLISIVSPCP